MPYNTTLEEKINGLTARWKDFNRKKMFGGVCCLLKGNMAFGIWKDFLIVRMDKDRAAASLKLKHVRPFDITGRAMAGWVMVDPAGWKSTAGLAKWIKIGKDYALSLPEKQGKEKKARTLREYRR
jgi:hypothetical protein